MMTAKWRITSKALHLLLIASGMMYGSFASNAEEPSIEPN
jgi:hypothetical protein